MWLSEHMAGAEESYFLDSEDSLTNTPRSQSSNCWEQQQPCNSQARRERFWASFLARRTKAGLNRFIDEIRSMFNGSNCIKFCSLCIRRRVGSALTAVPYWCALPTRPLSKTSARQDKWILRGSLKKMLALWKKKKVLLNLLLQQD